MDGKTDDTVIHHLVHEAKNMGCVAAVMGYRGIEIDLLTPTFHTALSVPEDMEVAIKHIKRNYPEHLLFAVGISYGK
jgi:predicted alpha/beta-fold hydrolase